MPWIPFVKTGYLGTNQWVPLVNGNGLTAGGGEPIPEIVWKKVSGTSPLSLPGAIANSIKSLVQFGKCATVDGDIYCNNGKLVALDDELPVGYKRITGIKFDGDFYYNTNESLTGDDDVTMTLANTSTTGQNVFGSYNGTASGKKNFSLFIYGGGSQSNSYFRYGEQLLRPRFGSNERTITFGKSGTDGFAADVSGTPETFTTPANAYIGMLPNSTSPAFTGSIIGNILIGNRLTYIPCERQSDNVVGYYELNSGVFLEPVGTGTPTKGSYDSSHLNILSVAGTPEVLTIGEQTAHVESLFAAGDYADTQDIISGTLTRNVGVKILDGTEGWSFGVSSGWNWARIYLPDSKMGSSRLAVVCSHFEYPSTGTQYDDVVYLSSKYLRVYTDNAVDETWQAWLAAQKAAGTPVIVIYPLSTETTEQTTPQPLSTVEGNNTVSWTAEVSGTVKEVEYAQAAPVTVPFIPKNSTGLITSDGKTFRVKEE